MINILWNIISFAGTIALALAIIGTCILLMCGIICIIKQAKEEIHR